MSESKSSSIGFFHILTIALICLKLAKEISLSWFWIIAVYFGNYFLYVALYSLCLLTILLYTFFEILFTDE